MKLLNNHSENETFGAYLNKRNLYLNLATKQPQLFNREKFDPSQYTLNELQNKIVLRQPLVTADAAFHNQPGETQPIAQLPTLNL